MATFVGSIETLEFADGTIATVRSLPIKPLRKFMEKLTGLEEAKSEVEFVDAVVALAVFCLKDNKDLNEAGVADPEDVLDLPTAYKVIEVCGGVKLNDPKLVELAMEMAQNQTAAKDGTN